MSTACAAATFEGSGCRGTITDGQCSEQDDHHPTPGMLPYDGPGAESVDTGQAREADSPMTDPPNPRGSGPIAGCCGHHRKRCRFGNPHRWCFPWMVGGKLQRTAETEVCDGCGSVCTGSEEPSGDTVQAPDMAALLRSYRDVERVCTGLGLTGWDGGWRNDHVTVYGPRGPEDEEDEVVVCGPHTEHLATVPMGAPAVVLDVWLRALLGTDTTPAVAS